ncbi:MAG: leucyl aminopeptidase [Candidatus Aminicenantes bacterium]|nr:leucyl aminopeptidase [Candidatus Aminicenantes bacterium]
MKIQKKKALNAGAVEGIVVPVFQKCDFNRVIQIYPEVEPFIKKYEFKGKTGDRIVFNSLRLSKLMIMVGAGDAGQLKDAVKSANHIISILKDHRIRKAGIHFVQDLEIPHDYAINLIDFLYINNYRFDAYLSKKEKEKKVKHIHLVFDWKKPITSQDLWERETINKSIILTRDMINEIPEKVNPDSMVDAFTELSREQNLDISIQRLKELNNNGMNGLLSVGKGSPYEPALIKISYSPGTYKKTLAVVGKGITFDSGGLNIKVGNYMEEMKCDMAGAATVLGIVKAVSELRLPVRIIGYAAIAENMPGQQAYKPGDIITYKNKKTVEVVNTDAEGRLILADALIEAAADKPDYIVEFSTLTGAILVALGDMVAGLMTTHNQLKQILVKSAEKTCDLMWAMPMLEEYRESIKSKIADLKNANYKWGSSIKAGLFLNEFVEKVPFAHIDVAGTAFISKTNAFYAQEGATGFGIRLIMEFLKKLQP